MEPALGIALLSLVFGGMHVGLTTRRVRGALVARLGEWGFLTLFAVLASVSFAALAHYYAVHRFEGAAGLALGSAGVPRALLMATVGAGFVLAISPIGRYPESAYVIAGPDGAHEARGVERITRHPFLVGVALAFGAHTLLAPHLGGAVLCAGLAVLALGGAAHQDRKMLARRGPAFADFLRTTSLVPFGAIVAGRQRLVLRELPWVFLVGTVPVILLLRWVHAGIFAQDGVWLIAAVVGASAFLMGQAWWNARRRAQKHHASPAHAPTPRAVRAS